MEKTYLTPNQVAEMLMVSPTAVRQWAEKGLLKAQTTPGGHRRFKPAVVERFALSRGIQLDISSEKGLRILVVDDEVLITEFLKDFFDSFKIPIITEVAKDGFSAGLKVRKFKPQIILLDIRMSGLDGLQVCRLLKADPLTADIRVIVMSGFLNNELEEDAMQAGAEACIAKPLEISELLDILDLPNQATI